MTAIKRFCLLILAASIVGFSFWLNAVLRPVKPIIDPEPINRTIKLASQLTGSPDDQLIRNWLFTLVLTDRNDQAYEFASHTVSEIQRFHAFLHINDALMAVGKTSEAQRSLQQAEKASMSIISADEKFSADAVLLARKGEIDGAFNQVVQIADEVARSKSLSELCLFFIKTGNFDAAIRAAHSDPWDSTRLLFQTAAGLFEADQHERGKAIAKEAFDLALRVPGGGDDMLERFALIIVRAGLYSELLEAFHTLEKRDIYIANQPFESIAIGFAKSGNLDKALAVARGISKDAPINSYLNDGRACALASVSQVLREKGSNGKAEAVLTEAIDTALKIEFPVHRSWALHKIAPYSSRQEERRRLFARFVASELAIMSH